MMVSLNIVINYFLCFIIVIYLVLCKMYNNDYIPCYLISALLSIFSVEILKTWYIDLRDFNTKLLHQKSRDAIRLFTDRDKWIMACFEFLCGMVCHRRAPVKSVSMRKEN